MAVAPEEEVQWGLAMKQWTASEEVNRAIKRSRQRGSGGTINKQAPARVGMNIYIYIYSAEGN